MILNYNYGYNYYYIVINKIMNKYIKIKLLQKKITKTYNYNLIYNNKY